MGWSVGHLVVRSIGRFSRSFDRSVGHLVVRSAGRSFARSFAWWFTWLFVRSIVRLVGQLVVRSLDRSLGRSFARSFARSTTWSVVRPVRSSDQFQCSTAPVNKCYNLASTFGEQRLLHRHSPCPTKVNQGANRTHTTNRKKNVSILWQGFFAASLREPRDPVSANERFRNRIKPPNHFSTMAVPR